LSRANAPQLQLAASDQRCFTSLISAAKKGFVMFEPNPHDFLFSAKPEANGSNARLQRPLPVVSGSTLVHTVPDALFIGVYATQLERSSRNGISIAPDTRVRDALDISQATNKGENVCCGRFL
jgi:hypothetical protein